jgi:hypothetical protein
MGVRHSFGPEQKNPHRYLKYSESVRVSLGLPLAEDEVNAYEADQSSTRKSRQKVDSLDAEMSEDLCFVKFSFKVQKVFGLYPRASNTLVLLFSLHSFTWFL